MKASLLLFGFMFMALCSSAQMSVSANLLHEFSIDYKFQDRFRVELGLWPGKFDASKLKPMFKAELLKKDQFDGYVGFGLLGLDPVDLIHIPVGMDFYPLQKKNFSIVLELINEFGSDYNIAGNIGVRYRFADFKKN